MTEQAISILLAVICTLFSLSLIGVLVGRFIYKIKHHLPTGDCAYCHKSKSQMLKDYHKRYSNN